MYDNGSAGVPEFRSVIGGAPVSARKLHGWVAARSGRRGARQCQTALSVTVPVAVTASSAHAGGVRRCSSPWSCPVCAPAVAARRSTQIEDAVNAWRAKGGEVALVTATVRHWRGDSLKSTLDRLYAAWGSTFAGRAGQALRGEGGGVCRVIEVTYGAKTGWHPHIHAVVFGFDGLAARLDQGRYRWSDAVARQGGYATVANGWDVVSIGGNDSGAILGKYLGMEVSPVKAKDTRAPGRVTPFELAHAGFHGDDRAAGLWDEYDASTVRRRRIGWTPGFLAALEVEDVTDQEASAVAPEDVVKAIVHIPSDEWNRAVLEGETGVLLDFAQAVVNDGAELPGGWSIDDDIPPDWDG